VKADFICDDCGYIMEDKIKGPVKVCPICKTAMRRKFTANPVHYKAKDFYCTTYPKGDK
jgi:predicted nucleic acid-binding Zn ribbon protein